MTEENVEAAVAYLEENGREKDLVYVIYLPQCHESLAGIVAGRIRERYHHPVYEVTKGEHGLKEIGRAHV